MTTLISKLLDRTFWKFILVGILNTLFGTGIMLIFYNCLHFSYWLSTLSNYVFGSILSYVLNRQVTFNNDENPSSTIPKFVLNIMICYLIAYGLAKPLVTMLIVDFSQSIQENFAMMVGMGLFVILNYFGQRYFVFGRKKKVQ